MKAGDDCKSIGPLDRVQNRDDAAGFAAPESGGLDSRAFERPATVPSARSVNGRDQD